MAESSIPIAIGSSDTRAGAKKGNQLYTARQIADNPDDAPSERLELPCGRYSRVPWWLAAIAFFGGVLGGSSSLITALARGYSFDPWPYFMRIGFLSSLGLGWILLVSQATLFYIWFADRRTPSALALTAIGVEFPTGKTVNWNELKRVVVSVTRLGTPYRIGWIPVDESAERISGAPQIGECYDLTKVIAYLANNAAIPISYKTSSLRRGIPLGWALVIVMIALIGFGWEAFLR